MYWGKRVRGYMVCTVVTRGFGETLGSYSNIQTCKIQTGNIQTGNIQTNVISKQVISKLFLAGNQLYDWQTHRGRCGCCCCQKKIIDIFNFKQRLLSRHENKSCSACPKDNFECFLNFQVFRFSSFQSFQVPSACLTFRHFFEYLGSLASFCLTFRHFLAGNQLFYLETYKRQERVMWMLLWMSKTTHCQFHL